MTQKSADYPGALAWLYETQNRGIKPGLDNMRRLLAALGWNGSKQRFLHVAGTNGKGSVCAMLDAICRAGGLRTGLFTSPHLVMFRERIRIGGEMIPEHEVTQGLTRMRELIEGWETPPTFFEITTALALDHFQKNDVDIVVLETGMGGRLDSTNVVIPLVSVITTIDLDHQKWLGPSLREIAAEKAGIIKPGVPVVAARQKPEVEEVLRAKAVQQQASLCFVNETLNNFPVALAGNCQKQNAALAVAALQGAEVGLEERSIRDGLREVIWPGRFQIVESANFKNTVVLDGAHNPAAAARLAQTWRESFGEERATVIVGILGDKDVAGICGALAPIADSFVATPVRNARTSSATEICAALPARNGTPARHLAEALEIADRGARRILVTGSLFLAGEALTQLGLAPNAPESSTQ